MKLRVIKIGSWWFIQHTARMKYYWFKYYDEGQARRTMLTLQESWDKQTFEEEKDMVAKFHVGYKDCLPAEMMNGV